MHVFPPHLAGDQNRRHRFHHHRRAGDIGLGTVQRLEVDGDRRAYRVRLTVHGRETFDDMAKQHEDWIVSSFDVLTGREMDALYKLLGKVKEHHHAKTLEIL